MKYLVFLTTLIATSTCSLTAMEDPYKEMIQRISNNAAGKPSITLVNNSKVGLWMEIGNLEKDNIRTRMHLSEGVALTFSPYTEPFCLKEEYSKAGALIDLYIKRPEDDANNGHKQLLIGGISEVKFGKTVQIEHNENTNSLHFKHLSDNTINIPSFTHPHDENESTSHSKLSKKPSHDNNPNSSNDTHNNNNKRHSIRLHLTKKPTK